MTQHLRTALTRPVAIIGALTFLALVALALTFRAGSTEAGSVYHDEALGNWHFRYVLPPPEDDGSYTIDYTYAHTSQADVQAAGKAMNQAAGQFAQGGKPFKATVVFARPLSIDEFTGLVHGTGILPLGSILRAVDSEKGTLTVGAPPDAVTGQPLDSSHIAQFLGPKATIVGVVSTDVMLDGQVYAKVESAPQVYAVDVMEEVVRAAVQKDLPSMKPEQITIRGSLLYPYMEGAGIAPQPK